MKKLQKTIAIMICLALTLGLFSTQAHATWAPGTSPTTIQSLQQTYPEGTVCTNTTPDFRLTVRCPGCVISAEGCWGFALIFVTELYDIDTKASLPATWLEINKTVSRNYPKEAYITARESVRIGDILATVNPGHAMVVIGMDETGVTLAEGNYGGRIHYGRTLSYDLIDQNIAYIFRINPHDDKPSDSENCPMTSFTDLPEAGSPEREAIEWAYNHQPYGLTVGTSDTTFSPWDSVTRAQALTFLWRAYGKPVPTSSECAFEDLDSKAYYYKAVLWGVEKGITSGTSRTTFSPDETCTRAEILTFLYAAFGRPDSSNRCLYSDVKNGKWYEAASAWAQENRIETGKNGKFLPDTVCTRASTILYIYRALERKALVAEMP